MLRSTLGVAAALLATTAVAPAATADELGSLSGIRFWDRNEDGVHQPEEPGFTGGTITLQTLDGKPVAETQLDGEGRYTFSEVTPGEYEVLFPLNKQSYLDSTPQRARVTIEAGKPATVDYGVRGGEISGMAWEDRNGDGQRQEDEPPMVGIKVRLADPYPSTVTDKDGRYRFQDLPVGMDNYGLSFEMRAGSSFSPPLVGDEKTDSDVIDADEGIAQARITTFRGIIYDAENADAGYVPAEG